LCCSALLCTALLCYALITHTGEYILSCLQSSLDLLATLSVSLPLYHLSIQLSRPPSNPQPQTANQNTITTHTQPQANQPTNPHCLLLLPLLPRPHPVPSFHSSSSNQYLCTYVPPYPPTHARASCTIHPHHPSAPASAPSIRPSVHTYTHTRTQTQHTDTAHRHRDTWTHARAHGTARHSTARTHGTHAPSPRVGTPRVAPGEEGSRLWAVGCGLWAVLCPVLPCDVICSAL
jgi:hypothetical protein